MNTTAFIKLVCSLLILLSPYNLVAKILPDKNFQYAAPFFQQTQPRFLITPYYGKSRINSYFDHEFPTYATNGSIVNYLGQRLADPAGPDCTIGVNCYDGHDGYDFSLEYDRVLASYSGIVNRVGWDIPNCHDCRYGIVVEINHTYNNVRYRTIYAHLTTTGVNEGQTVSTGQVIGTAGSTGSSSGPHLHFSVYVCINTICQTEDDFRVIDPFGWMSGSNDPWAQLPAGHASWCMWIKGEWTDRCDPTSSVFLIQDPTNGGAYKYQEYSAGLVVDDSIGVYGGQFSKGFGGLNNNTCTGQDPSCQEWWDVDWTGYGGTSHRFLGNGNTTVGNWAKWVPMLPAEYAYYEIFVHIPELNGYDADTFTWQAKFTVADEYGAINTAIVDQHIVPGQNYNPKNKWLSIGRYYLHQGAYVFTTDATEEVANGHCLTGPTWPTNSANHWCRIAVDAVKFVAVAKTYVPDFRNQNGWISNLFVRNDDYKTQEITLIYRNQSGYVVQVEAVQLPPNAFAYFRSDQDGRMPANEIGTVEISSNGEYGGAFSVLVKQEKLDYSYNNPNAFGSYNGTSQPSTEVHIPIIHKNNYSWSSFVYIQSLMDTDTTFSIDFKPVTGTSCSTSYNLPAEGLAVINLRDVSCVGQIFVGSAWIRSNYPIAVASAQVHYNASQNSDRFMESNYIGSGSLKVYSPLVQNYNYNWITGLQMQNATQRLGQINVSFRNFDGSECDPDTYSNVTPHYSVMDSAPPGNPPCSATASAFVWGRNTSASTFLIAAEANQICQTNNMAGDYPNIAAPGRFISIPYWTFGDFTTTATVHNTSNNSNTFTISFFEQSGNPVSTPQTFTLAANQSIALANIPYSSFSGSATIEANFPVAVSSNHIRAGGYYNDHFMSNIGTHR